jgi:hypothetical protein
MDEQQEELFYGAHLVCLFSVVALHQLDIISTAGSGSRKGSNTRERERVPVELIFSRLGPRLFRRCYRMSETLFWSLHRLLDPFLKTVSTFKR